MNELGRIMNQLSLPLFTIFTAGMEVPLKLAVSELEEFSVMTRVSGTVTAPCAIPPKSIAPANRVPAQIIRREFIFFIL
jgi:hypothetical protein